MLAATMDALRRLWAYFDAPTPRGSIAASVSFIIVSNQPFYPLYLYLLLGGRAWPSLLSWLSGPIFAAVPYLLRQGEARGAAALMVAGIGNTALCTAALGPASGVELFYLPCLVLPLLTLAGRERLIGLGATVAAIVLLMALVRLVGFEGLVAISAEETATLQRINAFSVTGLTCVMAFLARRLRGHALSPAPGPTSVAPPAGR